MDKTELEVSLTGLVVKGTIKKWLRLTERVNTNQEIYCLFVDRPEFILVVFSGIKAGRDSGTFVGPVVIYLINVKDRMVWERESLNRTKNIGSNFDATIKWIARNIENDRFEFNKYPIENSSKYSIIDSLLFS